MRRGNAWWYGMVMLGAILCLGHSPAWAETLYVQAKTAQLRAGKTSLDSVVGNVRYGEAVEVLSRDGNWTEVKTSGGTKGWIFSSKLSQSKPSGGNDTLARLGQNMRSGDASAVTASAGARGLDKASPDPLRHVHRDRIAERLIPRGVRGRVRRAAVAVLKRPERDRLRGSLAGARARDLGFVPRLVVPGVARAVR